MTEDQKLREHIQERPNIDENKVEEDDTPALEK